MRRISQKKSLNKVTCVCNRAKCYALKAQKGKKKEKIFILHTLNRTIDAVYSGT